MEQGTSDQARPVARQFVKLCECSCGSPTLIATKTDSAKGQLRGQPTRFLHGHRPGVRVTRGTPNPGEVLPGQGNRRKGPQEWNRKLFTEVGQRFGRSVVTSPEFLLLEPGGGSRTRAVRLRCLCGTEYVRRVKNLFTKSIPRDNEYCRKCREGADLTGQRFGKLVVIRWIWVDGVPGSNETGGMWVCQCDCENETLASSYALLSGHRKSCGCAHRARRDGNASGDAARRQLMATYQVHARNRGHAWELTEEDFRRLTSMDCHYCGIAPSQILKSGPASGSLVYNGLDRVDNALGYYLSPAPGNVVPCCKTCNHAKATMSYGEFTAWISRLASFHFFRPDVMPSGLLGPPAN